MKMLALLFMVSVFFTTCAPTWAEELVYGDYVEAFKAADHSTFYIYKSTIKKKSGMVSFSALEVKSKLEVPNGKQGEPYLALKYKFKYNCSKKQYTEAVTEMLEIEGGWKNIYPEEVKEAENTWRMLTNRKNFNGAMFETFCK